MSEILTAAEIERHRDWAQSELEKRLIEVCDSHESLRSRVAANADLCKRIAALEAERDGMRAKLAEVSDGCRRGANMALELWELLGEEGAFADQAQAISHHLMGTIISEDGLSTL